MKRGVPHPVRVTGDLHTNMWGVFKLFFKIYIYDGLENL
jgi:hypothetical protein